MGIISDDVVVFFEHVGLIPRKMDFDADFDWDIVKENEHMSK